MKLQPFVSLILAAAATAVARGEVKMPHIFSDNMVLQADTLVALWGTATPGAEVTANGSWGAHANAQADKTGRWTMTLATPAASFTPLQLTVTDSADSTSAIYNNVLAGEVWFASGQSNMEMPLRGFWNQPIEGGAEQIAFSSKLGRGVRFITVPKGASYEPQTDVDATWVVSSPENADNFSALGWFFATSLRDILDVPVGIISCAYGGSKVEGWLPEDIIARYPDRDMKAERNDKSKNDFERVGVMYNAMLLPVAGYTARGFLWNQGESNVGGHSYYADRQNDMVQHWRGLWKNDNMPFYFVELPGWEYGGENDTDAALFREAQHKAAAKTPLSYIVCTSDLVYPDEADDIHARNKRSIGQRMAWQAAANTYGVKGVPHTYPTFREMKIDGNRATLYFDNAWEGFTPNDQLEGFEVASKDRKFRRADARINRFERTITVTSPDGDQIEAVRYCFRNFAIGKIHDLMGMPMIPFRTDNWEK